MFFVHKRTMWLIPLLAIATILGACNESSLVQEESSSASTISKDSPGYIGFDFKFNIIGVSKDKTASMDGNNGKRIFVQLYGGDKVCDPAIEDTADPYHCDNTKLKGGGSTSGGWFTDVTYSKKNKILLTPCDAGDPTCDFDIVDANATDNDGAEMILPDDVSFEYEVYVRPLGKPGGSARITTCADEDIIDEGDTGFETWCSSNSAVLTRTKGKPRTEEVSDALLFLDITVTGADSLLAVCLGDTGLEGEDSIDYHLPLFDMCFQNYFWNYDNNGLKLVQVWFKKRPSV